MSDENNIYSEIYGNIAFYADFIWGKSRNYLQPMWSTKYDASKISPTLYISDLGTTFNRIRLQEEGITHIINLVIGIDPAFPEVFKYKCVPVRDVPEQNISQYFDECFDFIDDAVKQGGKVLVHCSHGVSRSASIVIAYLIRSNCIKFEQAYSTVKLHRPVIEPNPGFKKQLIKYAEEKTWASKN